MKKCLFLLMVVFCFLGEVNAQQALKVSFTNQAPASDGYLDEWIDTDWIPTTNQNVEFQILHDDNFFYVAVKAVDNTPSISDSIWNTYNRDCIEIYLSVDTIVSSAYKQGCWQIRFQRDGKIDGNSHRNTWSVGQMTHNSSFVSGVQSEENGWTMEATLPYSVLSEGLNFNKKAILFAIRVVDNTTDTNDGPFLESFWPTASERLWSNPKDFQIVQLASTFRTDANDMQKVKSFAYISGSELLVKNVTGITKVYNLSGKILNSSLIEQNGSINVSGFQPGMYIVRSGNWSQKIVLPVN